MKTIKNLEMENSSLKETLEIISDKNAIKDIKKSLKEFNEGNTISLSEL